MKTLTTILTAKNLSATLIFAVILHIFLTFSLNAQYSQQWSANLNTAENCQKTNIIKDSGNNLYIFGGRKLAKYTSGGTNVWTKTLPDFIWAITLDASGNLYAAGRIYSANSYSVYFKKFDNAGNETMFITDNAGMNFSYTPIDITVDNAGNVYIFSNYYNMTQYHSNSAVLSKYDSGGIKLWYKNFNYNSGSKMIKDPSGNLIIAGGIYSYYGGFPAYSIINKCNQSGDIINSGRLDSGYVTDLTIDNSGNIYATGRAILKLSAGWVKQWEVMIGFSGRSIIPDNNGNVIITGDTYFGGANSNAAIAKLNSSGQINWVQYFDGGINGDDGASQVKLLQNGDILVCGRTERTAQNLDFFLSKYSQSGSLMHTSFFNSSSNTNDDAACMQLINGNDVVLCGFSGDNYANDISFVKFTDVTGISSLNNELPSNFSLSQNYPNPFNPSTKISFSIPKASNVKMAVYDITGREVETLVDQQLSAGTFEVDFNASKLTSGVYFYRISADGFTDVKKMILAK